MKKLRFSMTIRAPRATVWNTMLDEDSYREWTAVFASGSHYVGDWNEGSKMLFLAPGDSGTMGGMVSRIKENRPYEYLSIEHLGIVQDGEEVTSGESAGEWAGALENYTFREKNGRTEVLIDMDSDEEYDEMMQEMWPQALHRLKELAESEETPDGNGA